MYIFACPAEQASSGSCPMTSVAPGDKGQEQELSFFSDPYAPWGPAAQVASRDQGLALTQPDLGSSQGLWEGRLRLLVSSQECCCPSQAPGWSGTCLPSLSVQMHADMEAVGWQLCSTSFQRGRLKGGWGWCTGMFVFQVAAAHESPIAFCALSSAKASFPAASHRAGGQSLLVRL